MNVAAPIAPPHPGSVLDTISVPSGLLVFWSAEFGRDGSIFEGSGLAPGPVPPMISAWQDYVMHRNLLARVGAHELLARLLQWRRLPAGPEATNAILCAPDGHNALEYLRRRVNLTNRHVHIRSRAQAGGVWLTLDHQIPDETVGEFFCNASLVFLARVQSLLSESKPATAAGCRILTTLPPDEALMRVREHWPCEIVFSQEESRLELCNSCLSVSNPGHNPAAWRLALAELDRREQERTAITLMSRIAALCNDGLRERRRIPSFADCAQACGVSERTLARRLAEEGTSFGAIVDEVRRTRAAHLIRSNLTVAAIAAELGYAGQSSINRSFQRWFDCSPVDYRRRV